MIVFPNCKINLGLNITHKREDGFHNIETVFYSVNWCDALEVIENHNSTLPFILSESGITINGKKEDNLIYKAWELISTIKNLPPIKVHLHKNLPMGAGLGGGSSDAAFFINLLNQKFNLELSSEQKNDIASKLGSDCCYFLENQAVLAKGKGNEFEPITLNLSNYFLLLVYPNIHSNTKNAYSTIVPKTPINDLRTIIEKKPINEWRNYLTNDFETSIFKKHPEIKSLKELLYHSGALYASMSGSGSSVFGIFDKKPDIQFDKNYKTYLQNPITTI